VYFDGYTAAMFDWTEHRFSGGLLALDLANTVVWPDIRSKRTDRFTDLHAVASFAAAASRFRVDEAAGAELRPPATQQEFRTLIALREAIDNWMRPMVGQQVESNIGPLFAACATATRAAVPNALAAVCARSAMRLLDPALQPRVKICPTCRWLFLDRSKNQSRSWCDMKVCGNRAKAQKHYLRKKETAT
jgi:predicted RNA-binding Zn ribbon-like protein